MNRLSIVFVIAFLPAYLSAQKKQLSFNEIFRGEMPTLFNDLPEIEGWADDDHYLEARQADSSVVMMKVHALTGKAEPYTTKDNRALPEIDNARNITFSPDKKFVAYTRDNNLFVRDVATGKETPITKDGSDVILNGYASWIYYEEILGRASQYQAFWWSPDSRKIAFMRFDDSKVPVFPIYVADGQHGYLEQTRYPKAGDKNPEVKVGIADISSGATTWADFNATDDQYFGTPNWTPGNEFFVQWMNRGQDSLVVYKIDVTNGKKTVVLTEHQDTWIALDKDDRFFFLPSKKGFILNSDVDGWHNLYLHDMNGKLINKLTNGNFWNTMILAVDEKSGVIYFKSRKENSGRFDVYRVSMNGKNLSRISFGNYSHDIVHMSPGGKYFITIYSNSAEPPVMALVDKKGKKIKTIASSKGREFDAYALPETKIMTVKSSDGSFDLPMSITLPVNFDSTKKYPVWISIYGGPAAGRVFDRWKPVGGLTQWWAQEGVIQVELDNRSSGHFGRKGINYISKQLGMWEIKDYMDCAKWLGSQTWVDKTKMGINGGSFGGYITCMALTYGADVFTHGIASYSVTDWSLYDTHYTERFMKTPKENVEGYKITSPLAYAEKYKGVLRIVHGTTDDNVHMQNSIQFINRLQDLNKRFEMMVYPNQRHGIRGAKATHNTFDTIEFIYQYMLEKKLPESFRR